MKEPTATEVRMKWAEASKLYKESLMIGGAPMAIGMGTSGVAMKKDTKGEIMDEVAEVIATMKMEYEGRIAGLEATVKKQGDMIDHYLIPVTTAKATKHPSISGITTLSPGAVWATGIL